MAQGAGRDWKAPGNGETRGQRADVEKQRAAEAVETLKGTEGSGRDWVTPLLLSPRGPTASPRGPSRPAPIFTLDGDIRFGDSVSWKSEARAVRSPSVAPSSSHGLWQTYAPGHRLPPRRPRAPGSLCSSVPLRSTGHQGSVRGTGGGQRVTGGGWDLERMRLELEVSRVAGGWGQSAETGGGAGQWRLERAGHGRLGGGQQRLRGGVEGVGERGMGQRSLEGMTGQRRLETGMGQPGGWRGMTGHRRLGEVLGQREAGGLGGGGGTRVSGGWSWRGRVSGGAARWGGPSAEAGGAVSGGWRLGARGHSGG